MKRCLFFLFAALSLTAAESGAPVGKFQQLDSSIPTQSAQRNASGAPGAAYWQNRADYDISVELDDVKRSISGEATVTYHNTSPDALSYLWVQLDQNYLSHNADSRSVPNAKRGVDLEKISYNALDRLLAYEDYDGEMKISKLTDAKGTALPHAIVKTMLRLDLNEPLKAGADFVFKIAWSYPINDCERINARTGYEFFKEDGNCIYTIAQWFPRMAAYTDYAGWINKQFLGTGEFTLEFGDYTVRLTVPDDHIVAATGALQNADAVLSQAQRDRMKKAESEMKKPMFIVTPEEAKAAEKGKPKGNKTWEFKAANVRDFAFATSRKFVWDAMAVEGAMVNGKPVMAMSLYPKEGMPLWDKYSTHAIAHTIQTYSRFTFDYPYPVAWSVNGEVGGMEYPMICFNGPRPEKDGTYPEKTKYSLIGVVIHEVGHNYFPMIVNSDERQWTWMDEGLNSFLDYMAKKRWDENFPGRNGPQNILDGMTAYMMSEDQVPIMTNSKSLKQFGNNAYGKPTAALTVLRETVMGRELFDFAFREFARRWKFKRPTPADFFRTMEDASGVDLDWFWRGWFYTTDHVDIALNGVREYRLSTRDPDVEGELQRQRRGETNPPSVTVQENRDAGIQTYMDKHPDARDFYSENDEFAPTNKDRNDYQSFVGGLREPDKSAFERALRENPYIYFMDFENVGGLVSPLPLRFTFEDGSTKNIMIPAEIWRINNQKVPKVFVEARRVVSVELDARHQTADGVMSNNSFPQQSAPNRLDLFRSGAAGTGRNQMADAMVELRAKAGQPAPGPAAPIAPTQPAAQ